MIRRASTTGHLPEVQPQQANLLIVDDDEGVRVTLREVFRQVGYSVTTAGSIAEARSVIEHDSFTVATIDLHLRDGNGMELVHDLAGRDTNCSVVVLTGEESLDAAQEALRSEVFDFLTKPCPIRDLKETIARACERSELLSALRETLAQLDEKNRILHDFFAQRERELEAQVQERTQELALANASIRGEVERRQQAEDFVAELSTPVLRIKERLLLLPLIGDLTQERAGAMRDYVLKRVVQQRAQALVMDCTGLAYITPEVTHHVVETILATQLLGASVVLSGLSSATSHALIEHGMPTARPRYVNDLEQAIDLAVSLISVRD